MRISDWSSDVCSSDLFLELLDAVDAAHLELHGGDAYRGGEAVGRRAAGALARFLARRRKGIFPEHQHGMAAALAVTGQLVVEDALDLIALIDLELDHRIPELPVEHPAQIGLRTGIFAAVGGARRNAAANP